MRGLRVQGDLHVQASILSLATLARAAVAALALALAALAQPPGCS